MPARELRFPHQVETWLKQWGDLLVSPGEMILIGSGGPLWHAWQNRIDTPLPENSMDVDPVTENEEVAILAYDAMIGSDFEKMHGWHVNLMPKAVLNEFPKDWMSRASRKTYAHLTVIVPTVQDLLIPKLKRGEPRDKGHLEWAISLQLTQTT